MKTRNIFGEVGCQTRPLLSYDHNTSLIHCYYCYYYYYMLYFWSIDEFELIKIEITTVLVDRAFDLRLGEPINSTASERTRNMTAPCRSDIFLGGGGGLVVGGQTRTQTMVI